MSSNSGGDGDSDQEYGGLLDEEDAVVSDARTPAPPTGAPGPQDPLARDLNAWLDRIAVEPARSASDRLLRAHLAGALFARCVAVIDGRRALGNGHRRKNRDRSGTYRATQREAASTCPGCYWRTEAMVNDLNARRPKGKAGPRLKLWAGACGYEGVRPTGRRRRGPPPPAGYTGAQELCDGCYATWVRDDGLLRAAPTPAPAAAAVAAAGALAALGANI